MVRLDNRPGIGSGHPRPDSRDLRSDERSPFPLFDGGAVRENLAANDRERQTKSLLQEGEP